MTTFRNTRQRILDTLRTLLEGRSVRASTRRRQTLERPPGIESLESRCLLAAARPQLTISDVALAEEDSGEKSAVVTVSLSESSLLPVTTRFVTRNRTATASLDYQANSGTLTFLPGQTSVSLSVLVTGDAVDELNEAFEVVLAFPTNATVSKGIGTITILDNDLPPSISVLDTSTSEGASASLIVSLSDASALPVTVVVTTSNATASSVTDYIAVSRAVTIPVGAKSAVVTLPTRHDIVDEPDETFIVTLSAPSYATLSRSSALVTIQDNDLPAISIADVSISEGTDAASTAAMTVTLSSASSVPVVVNYSTRDRTAVGAKDFQRSIGQLTIPAGTTSAVLSFSIIADNLFESNETFAVLLSSSVSATIQKALGTVTIVDDDPLPIVSVESQNVTEANTGSQTTTVRVNLNQPASLPVTVSYHTKSITAVSGTDFVNASGTLTIPAGASGGTITLVTSGDVLDEADETLSIELSSPFNATLSSVPGVITIADNDLPPLVSIANIIVAEGSVGTTTSTMQVSLSTASGLPISVTFRSQQLTASADSDFVFPNGTLTIPAGQTTGSISFDVTADLIDEPNEAFSVGLVRPVNARFNKSSAIVTITDDDGTQLPLFNITRDFKYVGAFQVPAGTIGSNTFEFGGNALAFNRANHSLFMASNFDHGLNIAEVQIPATLSSTGVASSMNVATVLQPFVNLSSLLTINAGGVVTTPNLSYENLSLGGLLVAGNGLTGGMFMGYNGAEPEDSSHSHFRTTGLDLQSLSASSFAGLIDIRSNADSASGRVRGGYMTEVPDQWKAWIGADFVTGAAGQNRIQYSSSGPALFGFDAISPAGSSDKPLVYYPHGRALQWVEGRTAAPQLLFNGTTQVNGVAFVPGTRSVIFIGSNGLSSIGYGVGSVFNDRVRPYQGFHSQNGNYQYQIWAYDIDDFMSVRNGTLASWEIKPTSVVNFNLPTPEPSKYLGGTAFDASTGRLYISQKTAGPSGTPIIHVYQLGAVSASGVLSYRVTRAPAASGAAAAPQTSGSSMSEESVTLQNATKDKPQTSQQDFPKLAKFRKSPAVNSENRSSIRDNPTDSQTLRPLDNLFDALGAGQLALL